MQYKKFREELQRLLEIKGKPQAELNIDTSLTGLDSLAVTELCVAGEEHLKIELSYDEIRKLKTFGELQELISEKGFGP